METEQKSVDYQAVLADLESKRTELDNAIAAIKRLLGEPVATSSTGDRKPQPGHTLTPTSFFGMSVGDAAKMYLASIKEPTSAPVIAKALINHGIKTVSKNFTQIVFSSLERKEEAGEIVRPKRGLWGLKEWYPGHRVPKKENGEKKSVAENPKKNKTLNPKDEKEKITVPAFEQFVREKTRRVKEVASHFGVKNATVKKLLEPESKVYLAGIGWLKVRE